jgi:heptosyltransferase-2
LAAKPEVARWGAPIRTITRMLGFCPPRPSLAEAKQILVIRPDEIGDVVLTSPFLRELRRAAPQARITLLVKPACYPLVEHCPYVDAVYRVPRRAGVRLVCTAWRLRLGLLPWRGFDLVILPRYGADWYRSELLGHLLAGNGVVAAQRGRESAQGGRTARLLYLDIFRNTNIEHEVLLTLRVLEWLGAPRTAEPRLELWLTESDRRFAADLSPKARPLVAIALSAGDPRRCWPAERFAEVAEWLRSEYRATVIVLGASGDPVCPASLNLVGETTIRQAAALIERCDLFIGNDSGLMHIAAAAQVPVVEISGFPAAGDPAHPNSPNRFGPWRVPHRLLQPAAGTEQLAVSEVSTESVKSACRGLLSMNAALQRPSWSNALSHAR